MEAQKFLRIDAVVETTGLARSTVYWLSEKGEFPKPVKLGPKISAWLESEVTEWQQARIAARDGEAAA